MNAPQENYIGPTDKREPHAKWTEIVDSAGNYHYFRIGYFYEISSIPAPRKGYTWYNINNKYYIVKIKTHSNPANTLSLEDLANSRIGKIIMRLLEQFKIENEIYTFDYIYGVSNPNYNINLRDIFITMAKNPDMSFRIVRYVEEKIGIKIENGELNEAEMCYMMDDIINQIGILEEDNEKIRKMIYRECNVIGPVEHQLLLMPFWDEVEHEGQYYYFQQGKYARTNNPEKHIIYTFPHRVIEIGAKKYIILDDDVVPDSPIQIIHDADGDGAMPPPLCLATQEDIIQAHKLSPESVRLFTDE
jgi:hypothetical protein